MRECFPIICGIDEAGRGPLAGDVFAAAVIIPPGVSFPGLDDSKKLTAAARDRLFNEITGKAVFSVGIATVAEIEEINILQAALLAMRRAFKGLPAGILTDLALIDGNKAPDLPVRTQTIVKGDGKSASIAAASVVAKVSRDRYMEQLAEMYPQYGFGKHKGYGTKAHYEAISLHGITPVHRKSFLKKIAGISS